MPRKIDTDAEIESIRLKENSNVLNPDAGYTHLRVRADGLYIVNDSDEEIGPFITGSASGGGGGYDYILIRDEKSAGTVGGTFTSGDWRTRDLNTIVKDVGGHASLSSNQITLVAGTYRVKIHVPAFAIERHRAKLRNITDASDELHSVTAFTDNSNAIITSASISGEFTISESKVFEVQHRAEFSLASVGYGPASSFGIIEIYTQVELWKAI